MYSDVTKARESLNMLVAIAKTRVVNDVADYIDSLDETTCKHVLRMIVYGSYKDFMVDEEK